MIALKIGIVSDGKFGDRAFEVIRQRFPTEWILVPFPQSPVVDDIQLEIPACDLYISYVRHPDVALALIEMMKPVILGISFGPGFLRQAKAINENIIAPVTMCSLEDNTLVPAINTFVSVFGRPLFEVTIRDDIIEHVRVIRGSPCGSTVAATAEIAGKKLCPELLQHYGLRICHFCRAPRFGRTCDKELSGLLHIRELVHAIKTTSPVSGQRVVKFAGDIGNILDKKLAGKG